MLRLFISLLLVLPVMPVSAGSGCEQDAHVQFFFDHLEGEWKGEAVITPVGPRPYDIEFERRETLWIYGQADPGAAIHHWGFYCDEGQLWLRFHSSFRGNRIPTLLMANTIDNNEIHFKALSPDFLEVIVRPAGNNSQFEVLHHGERHVLIELKRAQ